MREADAWLDASLKVEIVFNRSQLGMHTFLSLARIY